MTRLFLFFSLLFMIGCGSSVEEPSNSPEMDPDVLARYGDEIITVADMDAWVLALPPQERPTPGEDLAVWYEEQAKAILLDRLLYQEALDNALDQTNSFQRSRDVFRITQVFQRYFRQTYPDLHKIEPAALREVYEERKDRLKKPERRAVYHIFKRCEGPGDCERAQQSLADYRERVLRGENFKHLAKQYSDSETRHREGSLDWVMRGTLEPEIESVIFSLEEGVPSEPVVVDEGVHLFYVDIILREQQLHFTEARDLLTQAVHAQRTAEAMAELRATIQAPAALEALDREAFNTAMQANDDEAVLLSLGDLTITQGTFRQYIPMLLGLTNQANTDRVTIERAWQAYELLRSMVIVADHGLSNAAVDADAIQRDLDQWSRQVLISEQRRLSLLASARADEDKLKLFYDSNIGRFSTPVRLKLNILRIPLDENADQIMAEVERRAKKPGTTLADFADLNGEVEAMDWATMQGLQRYQSKLPTLLAQIEPGDITAPYRVERTLEIAAVEAREMPEPKPFDSVREAVVAAYMDRYKVSLFNQVKRDMLNESIFEINPVGLEKLRKRIMSEADISAEEIEALLQELESSP